ncbi:Piso0_002226 [Millerozyma farinosa CBS 7064]|uniref:Heat shock transcription factor n=1 Tax=Pichia sorbitophila (strain ATCC MYA-4447 / BCRC 22081 / CBS 7064 / NBRC 10061 / NRRL Y-12695) TaxID=559304 RepID=G8YEG8_PICSO|nr:Piso0_002226 [Millerozyma farinosa CBS 7064]
MVDMSNYNEDPIIEIFNGENNEDNDIQVINRDNEYDNPLLNNELNSSHGYFNDLYDSQQGNVSNNNTQPFNQAQPLSLPSPEPHMVSSHPLPANDSSITSLIAPSDYNQLTASTQPKFLTPLPPLQPLSEPVIPNGLNFQNSLTLPTKYNDKSNDRKVGNSGTKKRKENTGPKTRPAFVMKIWSMVNDPANHEYIRWNESGKTFQVFHREEFMKLILPKYFKHNNFASFVRQLNMYGWHKVQDINNGTLNKDDKLNDEIWQFENPYFIKGREDLLDKIVRNKSISQEAENTESENINLQIMLNELDQIKINQMAITEDLRRIRKDNKTLWQENYITRERHQQQSQTLEKILKFLATVYGNTTGKFLEGDSNFAGEDLGSNNHMTTFNYNPPGAPSIPGQKINGQTPPASPFNKPRLMLMNQAHQRSRSNENSPKEGSHKPSESSSVEEIIRKYDNDTPTNNVNKMYQSLINGDSAASPRHLFPELNSPIPNSPQLANLNIPGQQIRAGPADVDPSHNTNELIQGLEQTVEKQGQSIQQVQDWIQKLAAHQKQVKLQKQRQNLDSDSYGIAPISEIRSDADEFDVNEFLDNANTPKSSNSQPSPYPNFSEDTSDKRQLEDTDENRPFKRRK